MARYSMRRKGRPGTGAGTQAASFVRPAGERIGETAKVRLEPEGCIDQSVAIEGERPEK